MVKWTFGQPNDKRFWIREAENQISYLFIKRQGFFLHFQGLLKDFFLHFQGLLKNFFYIFKGFFFFLSHDKSRDVALW